MTPAAFRRFALSLPEAHEEPHFERASFRVGKKIFATMTADGAEAMVRVAAAELRDALLADHGDVLFSYGGWTTRLGSVGVRLKKADAKMIEGLVVESWRSIAPKRAIAAFESL
jgi:hypothetical protein